MIKSHNLLCLRKQEVNVLDDKRKNVYSVRYMILSRILFELLFLFLYDLFTFTCVFKMSAIEAILMGLTMALPGFPSLLEGLNINIWKVKETKFFYEVVLSTIKTRREGKQDRRNDLVLFTTLYIL